MLKLKFFLKEKRITQAALAEGTGLSKGYVSSLVTGNAKKQPSLDVLERIAHVLDVRVAQLISAPRTIPVVGKVGAGARVALVDAFTKGDGLYFVEAPDDLSSERFVAVEVEGDSMDPLIQQGDVLFFARQTVGVPDEAVNRVCILETASGDALVKQVKPGRDPRTWDLHSANHTADPIWGARLRWAAPLRRHLPAMDVVRSDYSE